MKRFLLSFVSAIIAVFAVSAQTSPTLYGVLKSLPGNAEYPSGIYSIPSTAPVTMTKEMETDLKAAKCAAWADGKLYVYNVKSDYPQTVTYIVIDTETWTRESSTQISSSIMDAPSSMYYNPSNKKMYGYLNMTNSIYEINPATGKMTLLKAMTDTNLYFNSLAANASGNVYGTDANGNLWLVYPAEGNATKVGSTGVASNNALPTVFDLRSGDLYMIYMPTYGSERKLYKINTSTASATEIDTLLPSTMFAGMFIKNEAAAEDALKPTAPTDVTAKFTTPGGKAATLSATAPTLAFDQKTSLTGKMDITFYVDDTPAGKATGIAPGAKASVSYTFTTEGLHYIKAVASNSAGEGPDAMNRTFVGFDTPKPVTDLNLAIADGGKVTLSWTAPAMGVNNGDVDPSTLAYTVVRMPENKVAAEGLKTTVFTETLPDAFRRDYFYSVTATSAGGNSETVLSNHVASGEAVRLPFVDDFQNDNQWNLYTIIDENQDGNTWTYNADQTRAQLQGNQNSSTDWLILPAVKMRDGVGYTLKFTAKTAFNQSGNLNVYVLDKPEVPWGGVDALSRLGYADLSDQLSQTSLTYEATEDGVKYFAIYNNSNPNVRVELYSLSITSSSAPDAPGKVTDLMVVAGEKGAMNASVFFKAPTTLENGETLTADNFTAIEIYAGDNDRAIHRIENPKPGQAYTYKDESAYHGMNFYRVLCFNNNGNGTSVSGSAWVGEDYATAPQNFKAVYDPSTEMVNLKWDAPAATGYSNGWVDLDNISYSVAVFVIGGATDDYITFAGGLTERTAAVSINDLRQFFGEGERQGVSFKVTPVTAAGSGVPAVSTVVIGDAYTLPFSESFADSHTSSKPWSVIPDAGSPVAWSMRATAPEAASMSGLECQDGDAGMAMFIPSQRAQSKLVGPKIDIADAEDPTVTFYLFHRSANAQNWFQFGGIDDNGDYHALSEQILIDGFGWQKHEVHLKDFNEDKIEQFRMAFYGAADAGIDFYLDNITISDGAALNPYPTVRNLKLDFDGENVNLTWDVPENTGYSLIGYYVYRDDQKITGRYITDNTYSDPIADNNRHSYAVQVVYNEGDSDLSEPVYYDPSGVEAISGENLSVAVIGGKIVINGTTPYAVYTPGGVLVAKGACNGFEAIELPAGIYFVKTSANSAKVIL